jgi:hypothetical protein
MLGGYYSYLVFKSLLIVDQCVVNLNIPSSEIGAHQMGHRTQNGNFVEKVCYDFDQISGIYGDYPKIKLHRWYLKK